MEIAFVYVKGRLSRLADVRAGAAAREFFYGALELQERGHNTQLHEVDIGEGAPPGSSLIELLYRLHLMPSKTNASLIRQLRQLLPALNSCAVVVATASGPAYGLALLTALGQLRTPLISIHCGIANHPLRGRRRILNSMLLRRSWNMLYGEGEVEPVRQMFRVPTERLHVNQFGVDTRFWHPSEQAGESGYVLAVGNDVRRDYQLLLRLAEQTEQKFVIVTRQDLGELPPHVQQVRGDWHAQALSDAGLRELYRKALVVITPLKESVQPSGQSVCLQAMACGKPVILTKTTGLWSEGMMRDNDNVLLVQPGDLESLRRAFFSLRADPALRRVMGENARSTVREQADISLFADRLETLAEQIIQ